MSTTQSANQLSVPSRVLVAEEDFPIMSPAAGLAKASADLAAIRRPTTLPAATKMAASLSSVK